MEALTELTTALKALPPTVNPYPVFIEQIKEAAQPTPPSYFASVIYSCYGLCGLGIIAAISILVVKCLNGGVWLWTGRTTPRGTLHAPNTSFLVTLLCLLGFITSIITMFFTKRAYYDGGDAGPLLICASVPWAVVVSITWLEIWTMATSLYLHHSSRYGYARDRQLFHPILITIAALIFFPMHYGTTIPLFIAAGRRYTQGNTDFTAFTNAVAPFTERWVSGTAFTLTGLEPFILPLMVYVQKMEAVFDAVVRSYTAHTVFLMISIALFLPVSFVYGRMLKSQIKGVERAVDSSRASSSAEFKSIKRAYNLLRLESLLIIGLGLLYVAECLWLVADPDEVIRDGRNVAILYTLAFLTTVLAELFLCLILLYNSLRPLYRKNHRKSSSQTLSGGITVETEVMVHIDQDENRNPIAYTLSEYKSKPVKAAGERTLAYAHQLETAIHLDSDQKSIL